MRSAASPIAETFPWRRAYPPGIAWDIDLPAETLVSMLEDAVRRHAARPAMDFLGRRWSYAELGAQVARAAEGFRQLGLRPGQRVGLCLPNVPAFVIAYHAVLKAGGAVVAFSPLHAEAELAQQAADAGVEILVVADLDPLLPRALGLLRRGGPGDGPRGARGGGPVRRLVVCRFVRSLPAWKAAAFRLGKRRSLAPVPRGDDRILEFDALLAAPPITEAPAIAPGDLAVLQYTGGTTGTPKGAMLTHANLCANLRQLHAWFPGAEDGAERVLAVIPLFHVFGMTVAMNGGLAWGAELILLPRYEWRSLHAVLRRRRPTIIPGVPTLFKAMLDNGLGPEDLASVRACISGGAPLPLAVQRDFESLAGGTLVEGYGLTEAAPVCFCNPFAGENRPGTIGLPLPGLRAEIRSLTDPARALPPGERGELCVAGPNVMAGYWQRPEETARVLGPDGFLHTGDVGVMDADGYVTLVDRIKDLILVSGFNVYPRAIEEAIYAHPEVVAATVVGMPDPHRGEAPAAFVQAKPGSTLDAEALRAFLKDRLSAVEMPRLIEFRAELPRTLVGKLSKTELRAELQRRQEEA
ncbi:MAG TPA: long-chain fatty acid--CoA ligase [Crenalkalicoccus sp.]|nr:long-chain fatty acid--CoA ligase [Crenalkalicoccus sp.]